MNGEGRNRTGDTTIFSRGSRSDRRARARCPAKTSLHIVAIGAYGPKVIGRFPGETSCLTLVWAVLDLYITHATNGVRFTQPERQRLRHMRYEDSEQTTPEEVSAA